jgi:hypothetical protein
MDVVRLSLIVQSALLRSCLAGARRARLAGVHAASSADALSAAGQRAGSRRWRCIIRDRSETL